MDEKSSATSKPKFIKNRRNTDKPVHHAEVAGDAVSSLPTLSEHAAQAQRVGSANRPKGDQHHGNKLALKKRDTTSRPNTADISDIPTENSSPESNKNEDGDNHRHGPKIVLKKRDKTTRPFTAERKPETPSPSPVVSDEGTGIGIDLRAAEVASSDASPVYSNIGRSPMNYEQCDLCQIDCPTEELEEHVATQHKDFVDRIEQLTLEMHNLRQAPVALTNDALEAFGKFIAADVAPSDQGEDVFKRALAAHDQVSRLVLRRFKECKVFMFGSTVSMGSWDGSGDIDLTLVDPKGWDKGSWPPRGDGEGSLVLRLAAICREGGFSHTDLEPLRRVRVPVLKHKRPFKLDLSEHSGTYVIKFRFDSAPNKERIQEIERYFADAREHRWEDKTRLLVTYGTGVEAFDQYMKSHRALPSYTIFWDSFANAPEMFGVDFDLSARAHGIRNSWLLRKYMEQSSLARVGSVFLKHWSKVSAVNYSTKGYFTSYAINILWVFFLLRRKLVRFVDPEKDVEASAAKSPIAGSYIPLIAPEDKNSPDFLRKVAATVHDFFSFYSFEFDWDTEVVSICREEKTTKETMMWTLKNEQRTGSFRDRVWYRVCIEDPFEKNLNLGRHASIPKSLRIRTQFIRAALLVDKGDFKKVLQDIGTAAALGRLQRLFPRVMLLKKNNATLSEVVEAIKESDPDLLASVETEMRVAQIPKVCGCILEEDKTLSPADAYALVNTNYGDIIPSLDAEVEAAGPFGLPFTVLHDVNNVHPLYYSSKNSKRLFATEKYMRRFDEHLREIKALLTREASTAEQINVVLKEKVPKVDKAIVAHILKDSRFVSFDGRSSKFTISKKAVEEDKKAVEAMDLATRHLAECDECGKRGTVYSSTRGGKAKYCEPCWDAYLKH